MIKKEKGKLDGEKGPEKKVYLAKKLFNDLFDMILFSVQRLFKTLNNKSLSSTSSKISESNFF